MVAVLLPNWVVACMWLWSVVFRLPFLFKMVSAGGWPYYMNIGRRPKETRTQRRQAPNYLIHGLKMR